MHRHIPYLLLVAFATWPAAGFAQVQYRVSNDVEWRAFEIAGGGHKQGEPDFPRMESPFGTPHPATNPEAMNIQEPTGRPLKPCPSSPDK
jgi:hypothetical protein